MLRPIAFCGVLTLAVGLWGDFQTASAQSYSGPFRGNYAGYYYSQGGYNGGRYFNPGYYPNPARAAAPVYTRPAPVYATRSSHVYVNHEDWSTGRTNYPVPLTKPWMMPLQYTVP